ncbi:hypothetical protein CFP56_015732 [Quercus suber]|uniref:Uncharacterized protein n=1 Tax=Quercus suber TaxID=58331 RepID=A0AAW0KP67_QUESU
MEIVGIPTSVLVDDNPLSYSGTVRTVFVDRGMRLLRLLGESIEILLAPKMETEKIFVFNFQF